MKLYFILMSLEGKKKGWLWPHGQSSKPLAMASQNSRERKLPFAPSCFQRRVDDFGWVPASLEDLWFFWPNSGLKGVHLDVVHVNCQMVPRKHQKGPESTTQTVGLSSPLQLTLEKPLNLSGFMASTVGCIKLD